MSSTFAMCLAHLLNHFHQFFVQNTIPSSWFADLSMIQTNTADVANSRIYELKRYKLLEPDS